MWDGQLLDYFDINPIWSCCWCYFCIKKVTLFMIHSYENAASLISCVLSNSSGGTWPSVHGRSLGRAPRLTCCTPWGDTWRWMACCTPGTESPAPSCICWSRASPEAAAGADSRPPALSPLTSVAWSWGSCYPPWADLLKLKCEIMYRKIVLKLDCQFYFQVWGFLSHSNSLKFKCLGGKNYWYDIL